MGLLSLRFLLRSSSGGAIPAARAVRAPAVDYLALAELERAEPDRAAARWNRIGDAAIETGRRSDASDAWMRSARLYRRVRRFAVAEALLAKHRRWLGEPPVPDEGEEEPEMVSTEIPLFLPSVAGSSPIAPPVPRG